eukprot:TRINITY_DN6391_c0_g1_i2.p1 TRINITY_DN6391_c0_g1~~TRINITY_DN6391_c0_g1_i2.p1  ORF type:complete len:684 (+),score=161.11 TRINITY_DN6391_c0_g1_i2:90-2141(+)
MASVSHHNAFVVGASSTAPVGSLLRGSRTYHGGLAATAPTAEEAGSSWSSALVACTATIGVTVAAKQRRRRAERLPAPRRVTTLDRPGTIEREDIRNVAIIAHVDHGKTTLTDALMKQCGMTASASMDSNQLEMERGITILAKNAAVNYKDIKINLVDTPGHADFGGEVERILNMADACLLLVDAAEGPMPQTKFVLRQALKLKKKVIVCINKVDKPAARPDWVLDTTFDLFASMGADDETCDFPVVYASGFNGVAGLEGPDQLADDLKPLLDLLVEQVPKPKIDMEAPLQMLVSNLDYDDYMGRICIGRLTSGAVKVGDEIGLQYGEGSPIRTAKISKLWHFQHNERSPIDEVRAGDICAFTGVEDVTIGDTIVNPSDPKPLPPIEVEEPTVAMEFSINKSPFAAQDKKSTKVTAPLIKNRLVKECLTNLALRMEPASADGFKVKGRGTLQLGILMENMRREGFEIMVGAPEVLTRKDPETGALQEPYEEVVIDVPNDYQGVVMEEMNKKLATMKSMEASSAQDAQILIFEIPTRNLIGMQGKLMQNTSGTAVMTSQFSHWGDAIKDSKLREKGSIVSTATGKSTFYSILNLQTRGSFFIEPAQEVYAGMVIGVGNKSDDLEVNITKEKNVTNVRAQGSVKERIAPATAMSIDDYLGHMDTDEVLEVTPTMLRLAKKNYKGR